jgi:arginyl-tRNA synthetase
MIRNQIKQAVDDAVKEGKFPKTDVEIGETPSESFGDYSTNVALKLSSLTGKQTPSKIAKKLIPILATKMHLSKMTFFEPGFINFSIAPKLIQSSVQKIVEEDKDFGSSGSNKGSKARVEFISANPTGPLHIGNARGGPIGDSIASVLEFSGYKVTREYYDNNVGGQVDIFGDSLIDMISKNLGEKDSQRRHLQQYVGSFIEELAVDLEKNLGIKDEGDLKKRSNNVKSEAVRRLFNEIIEDSKSVGIEFDEFQHESELQEQNSTKRVIEFLKSKGFTKEQEGALWFAPRESSGQIQKFLDDRDSVLVRSDGAYTYFADDIAYHKKKFESKSNLIINVLGSNHHGHVPRLKAAIKALGFDADTYKVILYQYVRVKRGKDIVKMSKRAGNYVTAREVLDEVGKDAFRFFLLSHSPNTHMDFDLEVAKQKNESNPVYYVQYAHARCANILKKAESECFGHKKFSKADLSLLSQPQELTLAKKLLKLPELVEDISENLSVHQLTTYSVQVADLFHKYYERYRVIGEEDGLVKARLNLVLATKIVLRNTLELLGVSAPGRM